MTTNKKTRFITYFYFLCVKPFVIVVVIVETLLKEQNKQINKQKTIQKNGNSNINIKEFDIEIEI